MGELYVVAVSLGQSYSSISRPLYRKAGEAALTKALSAEISHHRRLSPLA